MPELRERGVSSIALFGSVIRGEERPDSDVDLLVEFGRPIGLFAFVGLRDYLQRILGRPVDLATPDALKPHVRERVLAESVRAA